MEKEDIQYLRNEGTSESEIKKMDDERMIKQTKKLKEESEKKNRQMWYGDFLLCTLNWDVRDCNGCVQTHPCGWNQDVIDRRKPKADAVVTRWVKDHTSEDGTVNIPTEDNPETRIYEC